MTDKPASQFAHLKSLLNARKHSEFIDELVLAIADAECSDHDFLKALGGDGLCLALAGEVPIQLLRDYAELLLTKTVTAPVEAIRGLAKRTRSDRLGELADDMEVSQTPFVPDYTPRKSTIEMKRVYQVLHIGHEDTSVTDKLGFKRSVFRTPYERAFLQALILRFPGLHAFPNYPLDQLADFERLQGILDAETIDFGLQYRLDALLVIPGEGDPVAAFELSIPGKQRSDRHLRLQNRIFRAIELSLFRLSAEHDSAIGVADWYALLTDEVLSKVDCGKRLRVRTTHETLVPVGLGRAF